MGDCLLWWKGCDRDGYGLQSFRRGGRTFQVRAHRLIWEECFGAIPPKMVVRHKCDNPPCVNPEHLELGTTADNNRDRTTRGRDAKANQTHCTHNHQFVKSNTYITPDGRRQCRTCRRLRAAKYYAEKVKAHG